MKFLGPGSLILIPLVYNDNYEYDVGMYTPRAKAIGMCVCVTYVNMMQATCKTTVRLETESLGS